MPALYVAHATALAGRDGRAFSDDGRLDVKLSIPQAMGGPGGPGTNPEQIFAAGYAACFHSALLFTAGREKLDASGSQVDARVGIGPNDGGEGFALEVGLTVTLPHLPVAQAHQLVAKAHAVCPYSNALRGGAPVTVALAPTRAPVA